MIEVLWQKKTWLKARIVDPKIYISNMPRPAGRYRVACEVDDYKQAMWCKPKKIRIFSEPEISLSEPVISGNEQGNVTNEQGDATDMIFDTYVSN